MQRKKVIFHIGTHKTGTTYLQSFLSQNVAFLNSHGIDYPYAETQETIQAGACVGNVVRLMYLSKLFGNKTKSPRPPGFRNNWGTVCTEKIIAVIGQSDYETVLLSAEGMSLLSINQIKELKNNLVDKYEIEIILFVRDPFDYFYSAWKQVVKSYLSKHNFTQYINRRVNTEKLNGNNMLTAFLNYKNSKMQLKVINYDTFKKGLANVFLKEIGLADADIENEIYSSHTSIENRSLSDSEAMLLVKANQNFQGSQFPVFLRNLLIQRKDPSPKQKKYYNQEADKLILDRFMDEIQEINKVIIGEPLRTTLRNDIEKTVSIEEADIDVLMDAFKQVQIEKNKKLPLKERINRTIKSMTFKNIPTDFDPVAYIALNKDLEIAGVNPYLHYSRNGYREGRPYRYY